MNEKYTIRKNAAYRYDTISNGKVLYGKQKNRLPAMGWNSWNAFGSGNTEALTKAMADAMIELGLDKLGYEYLILDDGCYKPERVDGKLSNDEVKFPSGFRALADAIHEKGLKFGMYNDIGERLCAGAWVGTFGHEQEDAESYHAWNVDFLKVDNCYNLWDNATFSEPTNAKYTFAPNIRAVTIRGNGFHLTYDAVKDGILTGTLAEKKDNYVTKIGTYDGTGPDRTPIGVQSSELQFPVKIPENGTYDIQLTYATGEEEGIGYWVQIAVGYDLDRPLYYDDFLEKTNGCEDFTISKSIPVVLKKGENLLRIMNHRRQENTLESYATLVKELQKANPEKDILLSICEWGKTQPHNWGYKVGDSWRILNDITFQVGADGDPGGASWSCEYTNSLTSQYNKAVIMDEFAGLDKGWNDPDMMMIGMNGMTMDMNRTHMAMWCMMNAPLMLGLDLRRVQKGDELYQIIANKELIALNQDPLGVQAKRIYTSIECEQPDKTYIRDNDRVDVLAKPLADGSVAVSFINLNETESKENISVNTSDIVSILQQKMVHFEAFLTANSYCVKDLWSNAQMIVKDGCFSVEKLEPCCNRTIRVTPND